MRLATAVVGLSGECSSKQPGKPPLATADGMPYISDLPSGEIHASRWVLHLP
jgi:hypothetical protein